MSSDKRATGGASPANWRRWGALSILATTDAPGLKTEAIRREFDRSGWSHLLPLNGRWDALHRALLAEEKAGHVERFGRPSRWRVTTLGRDFAHEYIIGNPNIDPAKAIVYA